MGLPKWDELQALSDDDLQIKYNAEARTTGSSLNFYRDALWRRESERFNREAVLIADRTLSATRTMRTLTWAVTVLTLVNVGVTTAALTGGFG